MKKALLFFTFISTILFSSYAQNYDFENWTGFTVNSPDSFNSTVDEDPESLNNALSRSNDANTGSFSIRLSPFLLADDTIIGSVLVGDIGDMGQTSGGMPVSLSNIDSIIGYYKCNINAGDSATLLCVPKLAGVPTVGFQVFYFTGVQTTWKRFAFEIGSSMADSMVFALASGDPLNGFNGIPGSFIMFDDIQIKSTDGTTIDVTNGGFENWTDISWNTLDEWSSSIQFGGATLPTPPIVRNMDAQSGSFALELNTIIEDNDEDTLVGLVTNDILTDFFDAEGGDPFTGIPTGIQFYYKYTPVNSDTANFIIELKKNGSVVSNEFFVISDTATDYTLAAIDIDPVVDVDSVLITFFAGENPGSQLIVDNMTFETFDTLPPNGACGTVLDFGGINQTVEIAHSPTLKPSNTITIEAWIYAEDITTNEFYEIYRKEDGPSGRHLFSFQGFGTILSFGLNTGGAYAELDVAINPADFINKWIHVAAVYDGLEKKIYMNGELIGSVPTTGLIGTTGTAPSYIGSNANLSEFFNGRIDELRIWGVARNSSEIVDNASVQLSGSEPGLIAYYDFNESVGNLLIDRSLNGNTGNLVNLDPLLDWTLEDGSPACELTPPNGECGTVLDFDGVDDYVSIVDDASLSLTNQLTLSAWVHPTSLSSHGTIISKFSSSGVGKRVFDVLLLMDGRIEFSISHNGSTETFIQTTNTLPLNEWSHVACVYDGSDIFVYINGERDVTTLSTAGNIFNADSPVLIGTRDNGSLDLYFDGRIDEIRMWNVAKTREEIVANMSNQLLGSETNLMTYYNFNQGSGNDTLMDLTVNTNNGSLTNMDSLADWTLDDGSVGGNVFNSTPIVITECGSYISPGGQLLTSTGMYNDTITSTSGCDSIIVIDLTINSLPTVVLTVDDNVICSGETTTLRASGSVTEFSFTSSTTGFGTTATSMVTPLVDSIFTVYGRDANMCVVMDTVSITVNSLPTVTLTADKDTLCTGEMTVLRAGGSVPEFSFTSPTAGFSAIDTNVVTAGFNSTFIVYGRDGNGCVASDTIEIIVNIPAAVSITVDSLTLTASPSGLVYQWMDCSDNSIIAGETSETYIAPGNGSYAVITTGICGTDTSACQVISGVGINENNFGSTIRLYPNPTHGDAVLSLPNITNVIVTLTDVTGKTVFTFNTGNDNRLNLRTRDLTRGIYFITISSNNEEKVMKLIKQ